MLFRSGLDGVFTCTLLSDFFILAALLDLETAAFLGAADFLTAGLFFTGTAFFAVFLTGALAVAVFALVVLGLGTEDCFFFAVI